MWPHPARPRRRRPGSPGEELQDQGERKKETAMYVTGTLEKPGLALRIDWLKVQAPRASECGVPWSDIFPWGPRVSLCMRFGEDWVIPRC